MAYDYRDRYLYCSGFLWKIRSLLRVYPEVAVVCFGVCVCSMYVGRENINQMKTWRRELVCDRIHDENWQ